MHKPKVSILVGLRNGLELNKLFHKCFRELYPYSENKDIELVLVSYGSTDGTAEWMTDIKKNEPLTVVSMSDSDGSLSDTYNTAAELARGEYLIFLHNDTIIPAGFIEKLVERSEPKTMVEFSRFEPPIFPDQYPGKFIKDFGTYKDFRFDDFKKAANDHVLEYDGKIVENHCSFFMVISKKDYFDIGGFDPRYKPNLCEDHDFFYRAKLLGYRMYTALDIICYHFISQTIRFGEEFKATQPEIEMTSNMNFIRKWGFPSYMWKSDSAKVVRSHLFIDGIIDNTDNNQRLFSVIEPYFSTIFLEDGNKDFIKGYSSRFKLPYEDTLRFEMYGFVPEDDSGVKVYSKTPDLGILYEFMSVIGSPSLLANSETMSLGVKYDVKDQSGNVALEVIVASNLEDSERIKWFCNKTYVNLR